MFSGQCSDKGLDYQCHIIGDVDNYYVGDKMKLRQVLINILGNAVKSTSEGGKVDLTVERIAKFEKQSTLRFTIADTGIGMSKEYLPKLFETFTQEDSSMTNKYGSSGLGMAITRSIVEMMNGSIEVESEKGAGSTFYVTVTLLNAAEHKEAESEITVRPDEMTVLVVDDDSVACEHAKLILEKAGIAAEIAYSGPEAIEKVKLRHARRDPYNLILVDWKMPEMDGIETTRRMREIIGHESAIIILTAYRWDDVQDEAIEAGVDSFLPKPLFANSVVEEFRSAMKRKGVISPEKNKADLEGRHVLLAEDVQINAEIMMMVLAMREMEAEHAENGRIAVDKYLEHEAGYYDAILMDMRMPEMDGLEATRAIRASGREDAESIPIIALTANAFDEDVQRSLQAGMNAHLSKPIEPERLYETLHRLAVKADK
jgi:CheY-like chemotaxis protein